MKLMNNETIYNPKCIVLPTCCHLFDLYIHLLHMLSIMFKTEINVGVNGLNIYHLRMSRRAWLPRKPMTQNPVCYINICYLFSYKEMEVIQVWIHSQLIEGEWGIYASVQHTNIASDNGLTPIWCQAIIWTNAALLSIRTVGTHFGEILFKIQKFHSRKCTCKCHLRNGGHSVSGSNIVLTHWHDWGRDKMAAFSQTTLSNAFSWMKILEFRLKFH